MVRSPSRRRVLPPGHKPKSLVSKSLVSKSTSHNVTFKDHTGRSALMSWSGSEDEPSLPPLSSWVFYMVNPAVAQDFDGCAFQYGLENDRILHRGGSFRYEFFFLPGATPEECAAHYRGELDARGTIWRQIRKVKTALKKKKEEEGEGGADDDSVERSSSSDDESQDGTAGEQQQQQQLPGLVWPKNDRDCYFINYRGWFFMYPDADVQWGANHEDREVYLVKFDPIPIEWEEGETVKFDPMEHPIHSERMSARGRKGYEEGAVSWMENRKNSNWEVAANDATCEARGLGWESW
ncbi:hypothetical protein ACRALDRAFT_1066143 [Sodiomyces alcalophilus JCM 7366]|uniref:uncharacterized protein n=1 Tax=Sodiomyces alcalophilus JCM 7366 TaxID=591952 RepID=UPI0039B63D7C